MWGGTESAYHSVYLCVWDFPNFNDGCMLVVCFRLIVLTLTMTCWKTSNGLFATRMNLYLVCQWLPADLMDQ